MKNVIKKQWFYFLAMLTMSVSTFAQEEIAEDFEDAPEVVIEMDFNKSLYANNVGNMYMSESPKAVLMAMFIPQSYESGKIELSKAMEPDLKNFKTQEFTENGLKYYSCSGIMLQDGVEVFAEVMMKRISNDSCVMITSIYEIGAKEKFGKEVKRAVISAKVLD